MQLFSNNNDLSLFLDLKGVRILPISSVFQLQIIFPQCASACHLFIMYIMIVYIYTKRLAEVGGGGNSFP